MMEDLLGNVFGQDQPQKCARQGDPLQPVTLDRADALPARRRLEMSNNAAERAMKPPVLGRKNYLFCGSDAGGHRAACMYTRIESAKLNGLNPEAYLADVLGRIAIPRHGRLTICCPRIGRRSHKLRR
jgi:hypothetical protein